MPTLLTAPLGAAAHDLDGAWDGALRVGAAELRCVIHFRTTAVGLSATMDSVDQGATGIPVSRATRDGETVRLELNPITALFEGRLADANTLDGTWTQSGQALPLRLTRRAAGAATPMPRRPQTPLKPYPYREEEVAFASAAGVRIAGTLTRPEGAGPFPAAILIAGSGPVDRNGTAFGHHVLWVLADHLTRAGLAVLRLDKRGIGKSTGDYARATSEDFATDVAAGLAFLRGRSEVDSARIGLVGHSEGGLIAPLVAARVPVAFVVLMAGPGLRGEAILLSQARLIAQSMGVPEDAITANTALMRRLYAAVSGARDTEAAAAAARQVLSAAGPGGVPSAAIEDQVRQVSGEWMRSFLLHDPIPALRALTAPVLAVIGEKDLQVVPAENLPAIRAALAAHPDHEVRELPGLNHLFQFARTGAVSEYAQIEETIAPAALDLVSAWIAKRVTAR